jgi:hypothetical protein
MGKYGVKHYGKYRENMMGNIEDPNMKPNIMGNSFSIF